MSIRRSPADAATATASPNVTFSLTTADFARRLGIHGDVIALEIHAGTVRITTAGVSSTETQNFFLGEGHDGC